MEVFSLHPFWEYGDNSIMLPYHALKFYFVDIIELQLETDEVKLTVQPLCSVSYRWVWHVIPARHAHTLPRRHYRYASQPPASQTHSPESPLRHHITGAITAPTFKPSLTLIPTQTPQVIYASQHPPRDISNYHDPPSTAIL